MENQTTNVTHQSPTATNQSEPPRTPVLEQKTNGNVEVNDSDATADHATGGAAEGELAAEPGSQTIGSDQVQVQQKRRGRPRKCDRDGKFQSCESSNKKSRGRPRGSGRLQLLSSVGGFAAEPETAGGSFTLHVLTVRLGEDVMGKIASFSQRGPQSFSMISATGAVSSVILALPSGNTLTFEGRFEILSFSGAYIHTYGSGIGSGQHRKGAFCIVLAKPDGDVFGGRVEGPMIAAAHIQIVVGCFKQNLGKPTRRKCQGEASSARKRSAGNPDAAKQEAKKIEDEQRCASLTSGLMPTTTSTINGAADNVTPASVSQNMHSPAAALNDVGLETLDSVALKPILDQITGIRDI